MKNKTIKRNLLLAALIILGGRQLVAQDFALKTNLLYDAFANINLGAEVGLAPRWTLDLSGDFNGWGGYPGDNVWKHWFVQPEARYWFCDRFSRHFLALHIQGGQYNAGFFNGRYNAFGTDARTIADLRYQGWFVGAGIGYGYAWILGEHWNLEAEIGVGYDYSVYDSFSCQGCGRKIEEGKDHHYIGPTKAAINLVYVF